MFVSVLRNFAVVNLCAVLPLLWAALGWMPQQVKIRMRGWDAAPGSIVANGSALTGEECGEWRGGRVFRFYLRAGMEWKDIVFRLPRAEGAESVERVELQEWKLLSCRKSGRGLEERGRGSGEFFFPNPRFDAMELADGKVVGALAGLELLLVAVSWWFARRHREESWKTLLPPAVAVATAFSLLTQVALPVQSYLANRASYPFSFGDLAMATAWPFAWISVLAMVSLLLLSRYFGRWVFGAMLALTLCVDLEAAILSNDLARLNGDVFLLQDQFRALWDAGIWVAVLLALPSFLRNHHVFAALCMILLVVTSTVCDTKHEKLADKSNLIVHDFVPSATVIRNTVYSANRNVLVFIVDSLEREQAHVIMEDSEAGPKLREQFRGFTEYTNNVGALPQTLVAIPNLLTGRYPDGTCSIADYAWSCYGPESALLDYLETGHDLFVTTDALGCGYASRTNRLASAAGKAPSVLDHPGNGGDVWSIRNFTRWRWVPFGAKASVSFLTHIACGTEDFREWAVYPELAKAESDPDSPGAFLWIHTEGAHIPVLWNRRGEMLPAGDNSERGCVEQGVFIMEKLGELLDSLREKGAYDNSLILVLGDHGEHKEEIFRQDLHAGRLPRNARPCLWVKPASSTHDFRADDTPTGLARVADLLRAAARSNLSAEEIESILQSDKRIYRRMAFLGEGWTDWVVDRNGSFSVEEHTAAFDIRTADRPLQCGRKYPLFWKQLKDFDADFTFRNMGIEGYPALFKETREAAFEFRVPDTGKHYVLRVELYDTEGGSLRFRSDTPGAEWEEFPVRPHGEIVVRGVQADDSGIARVLFERASGPDIDVAFTSIMLEEEK